MYNSIYIYFFWGANDCVRGEFTEKKTTENIWNGLVVIVALDVYYIGDGLVFRVALHLLCKIRFSTFVLGETNAKRIVNTALT